MAKKDEETLKEVFVSVFSELPQTFDIKAERSAFENWDSFTHMQLVSEVESAFQISFEMEEIAEINTPEDFLLLIEKKRVK